MNYQNPLTVWEINYQEDNKESLKELNKITEHMKFMSDYYGNQYVAVGGIAMHQHMREKGIYPIDITKDGDAAIAHTAWFDIRDSHVTNSNPRLGKSEYRLPEDPSVDVDCYVEFARGSNLEITVSEMMEHAELADGIYSLNKTHLLALKLDKQRDFTGSWDSKKGCKIIKDNLQIFAMIEAQDFSSDLWKSCMNPERIEQLNKCLSNSDLLMSVKDHHPFLKESLEANQSILRQQPLKQFDDDMKLSA